MSKIIEKVFDAKKKIVRNIFRGAPNLFTSADLNRQVEALKTQLDHLEEKFGVTSDMKLTYSLSGGTLSVSYDYSYLKVKGCEFSPQKKELSINMTSSAPVAYLCLTAKKTIITYDTDDTHDLAGAKFEDGTSKPSADTMVYRDEEIVLTHALSDLTDLVDIVATFKRNDDNGVWVKQNFFSEDEDFSSTLVMTQIDNTLKGDIEAGDTYEKAINILNNRTNNICPEWTPLVDDEGNEVDAQFRIKNNIMYLSIPQMEVPLKSKTGYYVKIGGFPEEVKTKILGLFKDYKLPINPPNTGIPTSAFMPFGDFGSLSMFRKGDEGSSPKFPNTYIVGKMALLLLYRGDTLEDVIVGFFIDHGFSLSVTYNTDTQVTNLNVIFNSGPKDFEMSNYWEKGYAYISRRHCMTPLPSEI